MTEPILIIRYVTNIECRLMELWKRQAFLINSHSNIIHNYYNKLMKIFKIYS